MAFSEQTKAQAWGRAGGRCECTRMGCGHVGRCNAHLVAYGWDAHHVVSLDAGGADTLANCEALCLACHRKTRSYGGY